MSAFRAEAESGGSIAHANLEEFQDPANYDLEEAEGSEERIAFYCELATEVGGPVLEIACGTGLVALPIAARGLSVTGVDLSEPMLAHARAKAARRGLTVTCTRADARALSLGGSFRFVFLTGNAFQAFLSRPDQEALLAGIKRHLTAHGVLAFETRNPTGHDLHTRLEEEHWRTYTSLRGHRVCVSGTQRYEPLAQILHWTTYRRWREDAREHTKETRIACRFVYPQELEALLHYNGFAILRQHGDWDKRALAPGSPSIITICTHRRRA